MVNLDLKSLISKLNETCRSALEDAAGLCLSRTHYDVDIEHWLLKLLVANNTDFHKVLHHFEIQPAPAFRPAPKTRGLQTGFKMVSCVSASTNRPAEIPTRRCIIKLGIPCLMG